MSLRTTTFLAPVLAAALLAGCGDDPHGHDHGHDHGHSHGGGHVHVAPHGGALVVLGEEALHVELVLDATEGELVAYVLDGEAERAVRLAQETLELTVTPPGGEPVDVSLAAVANELTGETVGDTSEFRGRHDALTGLERFEATLGALTARGVAFDPVAFPYPEGNE